MLFATALLLCNCKDEFTIKSGAFPDHTGLLARSPSLKFSESCAFEMIFRKRNRKRQEKELLTINSSFAFKDTYFMALPYFCISLINYRKKRL